MFEHKSKPLLSKKDYYSRIWINFLLSNLIMLVSLLIGVIGYHFIAQLGWVDAIENSSMILTGMGPVAVMHDDASKLFASFYALYSGVAFLTTIAVFIAPIVHRFMHKFHIDDEE